MKSSKKQFTTARLKTETKRKVERAKIQFRFDSFESAVDTFLLLGIKAYREQKLIEKNPLNNFTSN